MYIPHLRYQYTIFLKKFFNVPIYNWCEKFLLPRKFRVTVRKGKQQSGSEELNRAEARGLAMSKTEAVKREVSRQLSNGCDTGLS